MNPNDLAYICTNQSVFVLLKGQPHTVREDHPSFSAILELLWGETVDLVELQRLIDVGRAIQAYSSDNITIRDGQLAYKDEVIHNLVVERVLEFMRKGLPYQPLLRFIERLMQNPSKASVDQLFRFLEHKSLPLTPNGTFLAYKAVRPNWTDKHSGTVDNHVGQEPTMPRRKVQDDPKSHCSYGLHCGSIDYVSSFAAPGDHIIIVEVDPADVVSVPEDCSCQKLRCCRYKVIKVYEGPLNESLYRVHDGDVDGYDEDDDYWDDEGEEEDPELDDEPVRWVNSNPGWERPDRFP